MRYRNWKEYNKHLVQRGSLTFLIDEEVLKPLNFKGKQGRPILFSDSLILCLLMIKIHHRLPYRSLEGFVKWLFGRIYPNLSLPTYSLICKRVSLLGQVIPKLHNTHSQTIIIDSSGMKVIGEGEWKVKVHGKSKRRKWLKLHIAIDGQTQEIIAESTTQSSVGDSRMIKPLLQQTNRKFKTILADGAYDRGEVRKFIKRKKAKALIPPPKNAAYKGKDDERDLAVLTIKGLGGDLDARRLWGKLTGYSRRVLVESAFSRLKRLFGDKMFSKTFERQKVENRIKCVLLNKMRIGEQITAASTFG